MFDFSESESEFKKEPNWPKTSLYRYLFDRYSELKLLYPLSWAIEAQFGGKMGESVSMVKRVRLNDPLMILIHDYITVVNVKNKN